MIFFVTLPVNNVNVVRNVRTQLHECDAVTKLHCVVSEMSHCHSRTFNVVPARVKFKARVVKLIIKNNNNNIGIIIIVYNYYYLCFDMTPLLPMMSLRAPLLNNGIEAVSVLMFLPEA